MRAFPSWTLALAACAGQAYPDSVDPSPLVGAWEMTPEDLAARREVTADPWEYASACVLEMEFFEDGTVETNWVNREHPCDFVRMAFRDDPARTPRSLEIGGALQACIYEVEGGALRLACDQGTILPRDLLYALRLVPVRVEERRGPDALTGTWLGPAFGESARTVEIAADGSLRWDDVRGRIEVRGRRVDLALPDGARKCRYRATAERLTLHCRPADEGYPETMFDRGGANVLRTTVLRRRPEASAEEPP
jgi:hypothetical protein